MTHASLHLQIRQAGAEAVNEVEGLMKKWIKFAGKPAALPPLFLLCNPTLLLLAAFEQTR